MSASTRPAPGRSHASLPGLEGTAGGSEPSSPEIARLEFRRRASGGKTVLGTAFAASPLRLLTPADHGDAAWVFLASLGGGLLDGDRIDLDVEVGDGASALLGTQASTKVYRSPPGGAGSSQRLSARVGAGALLAVVPDPVVCFADTRYEQTLENLARPFRLALARRRLLVRPERPGRAVGVLALRLAHDGISRRCAHNRRRDPPRRGARPRP